MKPIVASGLFALAVVTLSAFQVLAGDQPGIVVERPWARATVLASRPAVTYMTIANRGSESDRLVSVATPIAGHVMIHESKLEDGVMKMTSEHSLGIEPGASVELKPGGLHLMLMDLRQPLRKGESFEMTLRFEKAGDVAITVPIASAGAKGPD